VADVHSNDREAGWAETRTDLNSGTVDPYEAAWFLTQSRWWRVVGDPRSGPVVLGLLIAALIVAAVLLSPSVDSRFIYTDF
jgi:hypothetical protein